jgi:glyoxylase-like metal-dependent hydrolase (beta-lactamase superfamily II)
MTQQRIGNYLLPDGIDIFERGWLSANSILLYGKDDVSIVDTGYCAHQKMTVELVSHALRQHGVKTLNKIANTHLHSDHCGGNAALTEKFHCETWIPVADATAVQAWNETQLSYQALGQDCPRFDHQGVLIPGEEILLGAKPWKILGAPGHDHHSVMLYQPDYEILISADALWEQGFGAIFPELWGDGGFEEVAQTLELIEQLPVSLVIPGHGKPFTDVRNAIATARSRLDYLSSDSDRNARHSAKVLLKFRLLEWRSQELTAVYRWIAQTPALDQIRKQLNMDVAEFQAWLVQALVKSNAAKLEEGHLINLDESRHETVALNPYRQ